MLCVMDERSLFMKVLTFIVPSYNAQSFLDKCIPSLLHPDLLDELEVLIINDGSKDSTPLVGKKYEDAYPGTVRLINQENKGHGGALNTGCDAASARYLKIIDADDWVETKNLPALVSFLKESSSDVVLTHHYTHNISTGEIQKWRSYPESFGKPLTMEQIMEQPKNFERSLTFHGITYRTEFYREQRVRLSEKVFYEDHEFATFACCNAASVIPLDLFIYDYRIGDVQQSVSDENQLKRLSHMETVLNRFMKEYQTLPKTDAARAYFELKAQGVLLSYITTVMLVEPDRKKGRQLGETIMAEFKKEIPGAYERSRKQYGIFRMMNKLHIRKTTWEKLLHSKLYRFLRGSHDFN